MKKTYVTTLSYIGGLPEASILELSECGVSKVDYQDTGVHCLYKHFIDDPQLMIERALQQ